MTNRPRAEFQQPIAEEEITRLRVRVNALMVQVARLEAIEARAEEVVKDPALGSHWSAHYILTGERL